MLVQPFIERRDLLRQRAAISTLMLRRVRHDLAHVPNDAPAIIPVHDDYFWSLPFTGTTESAMIERP